MKNSKLISRALFNSLAVLVYVSLISTIMSNGDKIFGQVDNKIISPIIFLLLFVFSALLTSFLVLGKPIMLYLDGDKKGGLKLLMYTGVFIFIFLLLFSFILFLTK